MAEQIEEPKQKPWYKKWWGVLLAICIWPFFVIWYAWSKSHWGKGVKIAVTVVGCFGALFSFAIASSNPSASNTAAVNPAKKQCLQGADVNSNKQLDDAKFTPCASASNASASTPTPTPKQPTPAPTPKPTPTPAVPAEYKSALSKATSYSNMQHMSKQGVYDQLTSEYGEKFSAAAAQYAIDNVKADWNANALAKAKSYQSQQSMSPAAIHDQLTSASGEQFTQAEADYAIQHLND